MYICKCGKVFEKSSSLSNHKRYCFVCNEGKVYKCVCGREFKTQGSYSLHSWQCEENENYKPHEIWNKGKTKDDPVYGDCIKRMGEATSKRLKTGINHLVEWNKNKPKESYKHQLETRKRKFKDGALQVSPKIGRGKYSYFIYKKHKYLLRSTYEFIFALKLAIEKKDFLNTKQ